MNGSHLQLSNPLLQFAGEDQLIFRLVTDTRELLELVAQG